MWIIATISHHVDSVAFCVLDLLFVILTCHHVDSVAFCVLDLLFVILKFLLGEESRIKILSEYWRRCFNSIRNIIVLSSLVLSSGKLYLVWGLILVNTGDCLIPAHLILNFYSSSLF